MGKTFTLSEIAEKVNGELAGDDSVKITGTESIEAADSNQIAYIEGKKYLKKAKDSQAAAFVIPTDLECDLKNTIRVADVKLAHIELLHLFSTRRAHSAGVSERAFIDESAEIGKDVTIYPNATVMAGAKIGDGTVLYPGVVVEFDAELGKDCIMHANVIIGEGCIIGNGNIFYGGVVIGADGYGYHDTPDKRHKIPQIGIVRTGDRVELGANTCIDRSTVGETFVGSDTKFDNLSHLAHNCKVDEKCYIVAQVGIAGSSTVGKNTILAGQVGVADHVNIGSNVFVGAQGGIDSDVPDNSQVWGTPFLPFMDMKRFVGLRQKLPELFKRVKSIETQLEKKD